MVRKLIRSPAVRAGIVYAVGGLCFALGTLWLARALTPTDFAAIALVLAVSQLATAVGPMGANTIINRHPVDANPVLIRQVSLSSAGIGILVAAGLWTQYGFSLSHGLLSGVICVAASVNLVGSAFFRSRGRYGLALGLTQGHNVVLAVAALVTVLTASANPVLPLMIIAGAYLVSALSGWAGAFRLAPQDDAIPASSFPWREGRTIIGTSIAIILMLQFERLAIPKLLDREALATFAVLAAVAGSPFRVLQMGIGYTLVPQLRKAETVQEIRQVVRSEAIVAGSLSVAACLVIWLFAELFVDWFLHGKYAISGLMMIAAVVSGLSKVVASFGSAGVTALGSHQDLSRLNVFSWIAVCAALTGAVIGSRHGLVGVLFGTAIGWVLYAAGAVTLSHRVLAGQGRH